MIGKFDGDISGRKSAASRNRTLYKGFDLQPGTYIVKVNIEYDSRFEKDYDVNLAVYAEYPCELRWATHN